MVEGGNFIDPCGHFLLLRFIHCSYRGCDLHIATSNLMTKILQGICRTYISIIRGAPMLVQIFIIFYGLPEVGIKLSLSQLQLLHSPLILVLYAAETVRPLFLRYLKVNGKPLDGRHELHTGFRTHHYAASVTCISVPSLSNTFISTVKIHPLLHSFGLRNYFVWRKTSQLKTTNLF